MLGLPQVQALLAALCNFFPEVVTSMAAEQWESANQSVQEFRRLGYPQSQNLPNINDPA